MENRKRHPILKTNVLPGRKGFRPLNIRIEDNRATVLIEYLNLLAFRLPGTNSKSRPHSSPEVAEPLCAVFHVLAVPNRPGGFLQHIGGAL